jgi:hypothetical protein
MVQRLGHQLAAAAKHCLAFIRVVGVPCLASTRATLVLPAETQPVHDLLCVVAACCRCCKMSTAAS